jgi:CheY-like chemotaxis protein
MDAFDRNGLSPDQLNYKGEGTGWPLTSTSQNKGVVVVGLSKDSSLLSNYLHEEGYRVTLTSPEEAIETIRWEQPGLALLGGGLHGEGSFELLRRLNADPLTQHVRLIIWALEPPVETSNPQNRVIFIRNLEDLTQVLRSLRAEATTQTGVSHHLWIHPLQTLLANPRLRSFVEEVVDGWPTLVVAAYLGQNLDAVINLEMLCYQFDLTLEESIQALERLARYGYIEPLEFEGFDQLYGVVAFKFQQALLAEFGAALRTPEYRMALATLVLARDRRIV